MWLSEEFSRVATLAAALFVTPAMAQEPLPAPQQPGPAEKMMGDLGTMMDNMKRTMEHAAERLKTINPDASMEDQAGEVGRTLDEIMGRMSDPLAKGVEKMDPDAAEELRKSGEALKGGLTQGSLPDVGIGPEAVPGLLGLATSLHEQILTVKGEKGIFVDPEMHAVTEFNVRDPGIGLMIPDANSYKIHVQDGAEIRAPSRDEDIVIRQRLAKVYGREFGPQHERAEPTAPAAPARSPGLRP